MIIRKKALPNERRVSPKPVIPLNPIELFKDITLSHLERCVTLAKLTMTVAGTNQYAIEKKNKTIIYAQLMLFGI